MRFNSLLVLFAITATQAAQAGYVDERTPPPSVAAAASAPTSSASASTGATALGTATPAPQTQTSSGGSVSGFLQMAGWGTSAPDVSTLNGLSPGAPTNHVAVGDAIFHLLPPGYPSVVLDGPQDALSTYVTWARGGSRIDVLRQVAAGYSLNMVFAGEKPGSRLTITRVEEKTSKASAKDSVASRPDAAASQPSTRAFEVRLSDIRLSTSIERWGAENGVRIRWDAGKHVLISAPQTFYAPTVLDAVGMALATTGIRNSEYPLEACEYPNTPRLIRITRQGEQVKDCPAP